MRRARRLQRLRLGAGFRVGWGGGEGERGARVPASHSPPAAAARALARHPPTAPTVPLGACWERGRVPPVTRGDRGGRRGRRG